MLTLTLPSLRPTATSSPRTPNKLLFCVHLFSGSPALTCAGNIGINVKIGSGDGRGCSIGWPGRPGGLVSTAIGPRLRMWQRISLEGLAMSFLPPCLGVNMVDVISHQVEKYNKQMSKTKADSSLCNVSVPLPTKIKSPQIPPPISCEKQTDEHKTITTENQSQKNGNTNYPQFFIAALHTTGRSSPPHRSPGHRTARPGCSPPSWPRPPCSVVPLRLCRSTAAG